MVWLYGVIPVIVSVTCILTVVCGIYFQNPVCRQKDILLGEAWYIEDLQTSKAPNIERKSEPFQNNNKYFKNGISSDTPVHNGNGKSTQDSPKDRHSRRRPTYSKMRQKKEKKKKLKKASTRRKKKHR